MADITRNKIAAQIMKAEMMGDTEKLSRLKADLANHDATKPDTRGRITEKPLESSLRVTSESRRPGIGKPNSNKVQKFLGSTSSLSTMFVQEKSATTSDEVKMYLKTSGIFTREDMETKYFSEEVDDSQSILNKSKRHKPDTTSHSHIQSIESPKSCDLCLDRQAKHVIIEHLDHVYLSLTNSKPLLSDMSEVVIRNNTHDCHSFVSSHNHQDEVERLIEILRSTWKSMGYRCIIMETYFKNRKPSRQEYVSCGDHFQVYCLPIADKYYEKARMSFKQSIQASQGNWSMNKSLIQTVDGRRIQRFLPQGLSYFWVCFDDLKNGFGHVIESERDFSRFFGLEILSGVLNRSFDPSRLRDREHFREQFDRSRDFKLLFCKHKPQ